MPDIFEDLDSIIKNLEKDQIGFLHGRAQLERESGKSDELVSTYKEFDELYKKFRYNVGEIIVASSGLKEIKKTRREGLMALGEFTIASDQLKTRIQSLFTTIEEDISPKLEGLMEELIRYISKREKIGRELESIPCERELKKARYTIEQKSEKYIKLDTRLEDIRSELRCTIDELSDEGIKNRLSEIIRSSQV